MSASLLASFVGSLNLCIRDTGICIRPLRLRARSAEIHQHLLVRAPFCGYHVCEKYEGCL